MSTLTIGQVARNAGVGVETIRFYEREGLLEVNAGEVIHEAAMALRFRATADDFIDLIHVYPTMAEALKLVAISFTKDVNRLSCCAS